MLPSARFELRPRAPYSLDRTTSRFTRFEERVDRVAKRSYARLILVGGKPLLVRVTATGPPSRPRLAVEMRGHPARSTAARPATERLLERVLGVSHELPSFYRALGGDPVLADPIRVSRGLSIAGFGDAFEATITAILAQQVNLTFAYSIRAELALAFGRRARIDGETWVAFPTARRLARETPEDLRRFRLSGAKAGAISGVARAFASGELDDDELMKLDDDDVIERLTALKGVGRWTAETVLIRGLARRDAFPAGDLGVIKYLAQGLLGRTDVAPEAEMRSFAERWRPYRSYALVYAYDELARRASEAS